MLGLKLATQMNLCYKQFLLTGNVGIPKGAIYLLYVDDGFLSRYIKPVIEITSVLFAGIADLLNPLKKNQVFT